MSKDTSDGSMEPPDSGSEEEAVNHEVETASILPAIDGSAEAESNEGAAESDPFAGSAEDLAAKETRRKIELFEWADSVLGLNETELELALDDAVKRFGMSRRALKRIIRARRSEKSKAKAKAERSRAEPKDDENNVKYYSPDFKVSDRGVFARKFDDHGHPFWDRICTTRIDLVALTRDRREENWGTYIVITNRDGGRKKLAVPHALTAADKVAEIASLLASLGVGIVPSRQARQLLVQFLTLEVPERITAVPQIGWHSSGDTWLFVLPDETIVPAGFRWSTARPTNSKPPCAAWSRCIRHRRAMDRAGCSSRRQETVMCTLCVGTAFAGPLLKWAMSHPGFFTFGERQKLPSPWSVLSASRSGVDLRCPASRTPLAQVGRRPPSASNATPSCEAIWAPTLTRSAKARRKLSGPRSTSWPMVRTKLRGTPDIDLRPMESFRILGISTGEPTIEAYLSSGGEKVPAGLKVRLVDVPAEVQPEQRVRDLPAQTELKSSEALLPAHAGAARGGRAGLAATPR